MSHCVLLRAVSAMNQRDVLSFFIIFAGSCLPWFPTKASAQNDLFECKRDVLGALFLTDAVRFQHFSVTKCACG